MVIGGNWLGLELGLRPCPAMTIREVKDMVHGY